MKTNKDRGLAHARAYYLMSAMACCSTAARFEYWLNRRAGIGPQVPHTLSDADALPHIDRLMTQMSGDALIAGAPWKDAALQALSEVASSLGSNEP